MYKITIPASSKSILNKIVQDNKLKGVNVESESNGVTTYDVLNRNDAKVIESELAKKGIKIKKEMFNNEENIFKDMNPTQIVKKIREQFNELIKSADMPMDPAMPPATEPAMPMKHKLKDGTEVEVTEMAIGGVVTIEGQPAPVGEHILEDGTTIILGDNGAITEIVEATDSADAPPTDMPTDMGAKFSAFETSTNEKFSSYEVKFAEYETKFADYESKLNKATKVIDGLLKLTEVLAEQPTGAVDPSVKSINNFSSVKEEEYSILFS